MKIMTHVVAGYRSLEETARLIEIMSECEVDYIEVQIPFSDPIGDGPTITHANQYALEQGMTVEKSLTFFEKIARNTDVSFLVMTYINIAYRYGFSEFITRLKNIGARGAIIPDLPYIYSEVDTDVNTIFEASSKEKFPLVPVISPNISVNKMKHISRKMKECDNDFMVYCTQRTGITGTHDSVSAKKTQELFEYLELAHNNFDAEIAGGFGIKSVDQVQSLSEVLDVAVIGSHIINLYKDTNFNNSSDFDKALSNIGSFLSSLKN